MCGIAGIYHFTDEPIDPAQIIRMTHLQHHRGPDDWGFAFFDQKGQCRQRTKEPATQDNQARLALGHRRLTIIDLSTAAAQPMSSGEQNYWITYNGEIYNYRELREELSRLGYTFATSSDTEVILKAYEQWGYDCLGRFNGMWAFAIWDVRKGVLFCSRDRMGVKPFYYYLDSSRFVFASEIKAILSVLPGEKRLINEPYLARFIIHGILNDRDESLFAAVKQLPPGCSLEITSGGIRKWQYWDIPRENITLADTACADEAQAVERFRDLLADAIKLRFRADVPVGVCLSGGMDSSSVTALARRSLPFRLSTFTAEYPQPEFSEGHFARTAATAFDTDAHYISPQPAQYIDFIERFSWYHDEPCSGPGVFSQWHVMELAKNHVKVVLEGQGADELIGGYYHYFDYYLASVFKRLFNLGPARTSLRQYMSDIRAIAQLRGVSYAQGCIWALRHQAGWLLPRQAKKFLRILPGVIRGTGDGLIRELTDPGFLSQALAAYQPRNQRYYDDLNNILYWDLRRDNLPLLLQYGDRTSMAFSLESRMPFLDYRLIEFVGSLPYHFKIRGPHSKYILRRAMRGILPEEIIDRRDKMGFPTPFSHWLRGPLRDYAHQLFSNASFREHHLFRPDKAQALLQEHCKGIADHSWLLWRIMNIEKWLTIFFDNFDSTCRKHLADKF